MDNERKGSCSERTAPQGYSSEIVVNNGAFQECSRSLRPEGEALSFVHFSLHGSSV